MKNNRINELTKISRTWNIILIIPLVFAAFIVLVPLINIIIASFSSKESLSVKGFSFFPNEWSLEGYTFLFQFGDQLWRGYYVSIWYSVIGTAISLFMMSLYAYVIWQKGFGASKFYTWVMLITMLFNGGIVPQYILITRYLQIDDTAMVLLTHLLMHGFYIVILRSFLKTAIPDSVVESARIDGAGHFRIYFSIVLPLFKAGLATVGLFGFVYRWNDWFTPVLYISNPELVPLQTFLFRMQSYITFLTANAQMATTPEGLALLRNMPGRNLIMACTVVAIVPVLFAYPFFQRFFVRGMLIGSVKE